MWGSTDGKDKDQARDLIKISKMRGRLDPPIPLVMRIVILFDWRMKYLLCSIGPKDSNPNFNWMAIHSQILIGPWRMRRPLIGAKGFQSFHRTRETSSRKVMEAYQAGRHCVYAKKGEGRGEWSVRKVVSSCVWEVFMERLWKNEAWNGIVCSK